MHKINNRFLPPIPIKLSRKFKYLKKESGKWVIKQKYILKGAILALKRRMLGLEP
jgi:hypothetical protein